MKQQRTAVAGHMDPETRSDCRVEFTRLDRGGIVVKVESKVESLYGESIRTLVTEVCRTLGVQHAALRVEDQGALPFVLAARVEAAVKRADRTITAAYLPGDPQTRPSPSTRIRPRRTRLYVPGNEPKFMPNAALHRPDTLILDLEDSVSPDEKDTARLVVRNALRTIGFGRAECAVRINQGALGVEDLRAVIPQRPDVILMPKCEDADAVRTLVTEIMAVERKHQLPAETLLLPIIESAPGVENAFAIASASPRVCALAIGLEDYTADIGVERTAEGKESLFARLAVINAAKAAGVQALDSVWSDVDDMEGLHASTIESKALGFDGKGCIHPRQIPVIHGALRPSPKEIERAERIVEAAKFARANGSGVVSLGSKMIDAPVVRRAERVLELVRLYSEEEGRS